MMDDRQICISDMISVCGMLHLEITESIQGLYLLWFAKYVEVEKEGKGEFRLYHSKMLTILVGRSFLLNIRSVILLTLARAYLLYIVYNYYCTVGLIISYFLPLFFL